jgi:hypothetical protein
MKYSEVAQRQWEGGELFDPLRHYPSVIRRKRNPLTRGVIGSTPLAAAVFPRATSNVP